MTGLHCLLFVYYYISPVYLAVSFDQCVI